MTTDGSGRLLLAYHAWTPGQVGYHAGGERRLYFSYFRFSYFRTWGTGLSLT